MTRRFSRGFLLTAAVVAAVVFLLAATLPSRPERLSRLGDANLERRTIAGALHIHTTRSDGTSDKAAIAAAAGRAGLQFAVFSDHGDGTRPPDPPAYMEGVLCLDGVEISTDTGHYIAVGLAASPYPLGGAGAAVVEDVARLGGFGIAAHPESPKASLRWRESEAPIDALEWLSADSEWRDETRARLARALTHYLLRPAPALASLLDRPAATLARWDSMTRNRAVVALAGHDAHGGVGGAVEDGQRRWLPHVPSYEAAFRSMSVRLILDQPLTGDASVDSAMVLSALRGGRTFTAIDAVAGPPALDFRLRADGRELRMGESAPFAAAWTAMVRASVPSGAHTVLIHNGDEIATARGGYLEHPATAAGAYRVEVRAPRAPGSPPVPWLLSNPIYLWNPAAAQRAVPPTPDIVLPLEHATWHVEHDPGSRATLATSKGAVRMDYELRPGERASQFVALVTDLPAQIPPFQTVRFTGHASAPSRISVQLRFSGSGDVRWLRSVFLSPQPAPAAVHFRDMQAAGNATPATPDPRRATSLLFVLDLTNAAPGTSGWFSISDVALAN